MFNSSNNTLSPLPSENNSTSNCSTCFTKACDQCGLGAETDKGISVKTPKKGVIASFLKKVFS